MCDQNNQDGSCKDNNQQEDPASRPEQQLPMRDIYCILHEEYNPSMSSASDFLLAMIESLTDYILTLVGSEGNNNTGMPTNPQDGEREAESNCEGPPIILDMSFSFSDEMPGPRKNG
ncbi:huntingtin-interacting protein M [Fukomys damarensis]|uniref:Huntingtin-interacting protein M n=1 Tax=Fukomys damarensis TaxID=885580 RepID=A0A091DZL9_FUKDA|nr:huntingtin-interacting protein M [Fukomys damarensis]XP_010634529.1 huntingtin-interacting protein M [Fukomys damarensis]KFO28241.1 Huntingtin-interacting protein M [Fukomys damarensis]KFO28242.1 Huntingtin-interacting protein M [Fukomys damarensis]